MLATSRMWRSTLWTLAVWSRQPRAGAPAGAQRLGGPTPFQTTFPRGRLHRVHTFSSRPIRQWPCLIRSGRVAAEAEGEVVGAVAAVVARVEAEAREAGVAVAEAEVLAAVVVREAVARAAPVEVVGLAAAVKAAPAVAQAAARAEEDTLPAPIIIIRLSTSRGPSCRHSRLRLRPTNRSWLRWRKARAVSRFSTPMTSWVDSNASGESKTSSTSWGTCPATRRKEAATR